MSEFQSRYYEATAAGYDEQHLRAGDEHFVALEYTLAMCAMLGAKSVLDVGSGTGRVSRFLLSRQPELEVVGVEPVAALREQAEKFGAGRHLHGTGEDLPFEDDTFDVVLATAVMHHVPQPDKVVSEMTRVARNLVCISDTNRFANGGRMARAVKTTAWRLGGGEALKWAWTRGKGYLELEGDGQHYPYSTYDSQAQLSDWADRTFMIPTSGRKSRYYSGPLLTASHTLLVGVREPRDGTWASE